MADQIGQSSAQHMIAVCRGGGEQLDGVQEVQHGLPIPDPPQSLHD